ncbi:YdbC family protein [Clostridium butyricum]|uniref:YdbC family protein n=1 Tax=Clostridium butyricum TaxID=1492 RepID=UPI00374EF7D9
MADIKFKFEIEKELGVIAESAKGWKKELNLISWNGKEAKYDLREWSPEHEKMGKGVTLSNEELKALKELLNSMEI